MRYVRLVAVCDEYDCDPGLVVKGTQMVEGMMADRNGSLIAHDLLEHQNGVKNIGPIDDELEAIGAIWQVRGRHYDLCPDDPRMGSAYTVHQNVAADVGRMFMEIPGDGWWPYPGQYRTHRTDYEDDFEEILSEARSQIVREVDDHQQLDDCPVDVYLDNALHLMRRGFRKAQRRFGDGYEGITLYKAIQRAVKRTLVEFEGQEFRLAYGNGEALVTEIYEDSYD